MTANYEVKGSVAVVTLDSPPVNSLGLPMRMVIADSVQRALEDNAIKSIVIVGAGRAFSGGADIKEFNSPAVLAEPSLHTLISMLENSTKPVIAAIHGVCMGGGLEMALACHYRVATVGAQIALPEVKLGLLPGAGGTQRLPRKVGLEMALKMIVSGDPELSENLFELGLFDKLIEDDLVQGALTFADAIADVRPLPKVRNLNIVHPDFEILLQAARDATRKMAGPFPAPLKCIDSIAAAVTMKFDDGLKFEKALFIALLQTPESMALRHAFFAERAASKIPDVPPTPTRSIKSAAVIGGGTMGVGIAMCFANSGIAVTLLEVTQQALDNSLATIRINYENTMRKGRLSIEKFEQRLSLIKGTLSYADISQADIAIEAVFEEMGLKEVVFKKLDEVMKPGAILASNTSTLNIDEIAAFTERPQDVVGMHFFSPAQVMRALEIVRGAKTSNEVLVSAMALAKKLKKIGVVCGVCDGFIGNRMIEQYARQAGFLLEEGCLPQQVDRAIEKFGFAMGPFRMSDLSGNDVGWAVRKRHAAEIPDVAVSTIADILCEMGRFGQKTNAGWYDYTIGEREAHPSPIVNDMIIRHSADLGVTRRVITDQEIVERLVYALVNEAAFILEEGIAARASDIDMIYLSGYGFPLFRGGPMFYADLVGLANVVLAMEKYATGRYGDVWKPAPLLTRLAAEGKFFNG